MNDPEANNGQTSRDALRSKVVMPDEIEETELRVGGTREYRRNALSMIAFGVALIFGPIVFLLFTGRFFFILPIIGFFIAGWGTLKFMESYDDGKH